MMVPTTKNGLPLIENDPPRQGVGGGCLNKENFPLQLGLIMLPMGRKSICKAVGCSSTWFLSNPSYICGAWGQPNYPPPRPGHPQPSQSGDTLLMDDL